VTKAVKVAYLSAEFGLNESLPIYSGGLGVLAGDFMKTAGDVGFPMVGVGILYGKGYFQQQIEPDGSQRALYPELQRNELPIEPMIQSDGSPLRVEVPMGSQTIQLAVWRTFAGTVPVYLLDADIEENVPELRRLTDRLYGGDMEERICHEIILGIGGVRCLRALGEAPTLWHLNEGHVAFSTLERIREFSAQGLDFGTALEAVRSTTVFTTHTPVAAGHDAFDVALMDKYFSTYYWQLGAQRQEILALGLVDHHFNMTRLAFSVAARVNGVSQLHAKVSAELFHHWLPSIPAEDIDVAAVTNGVHVHTWLSPELRDVYRQYLPPSWVGRLSDRDLWDKVQLIPDRQLWDAHQAAKKRMIERFQLPMPVDALVVGFARRFATYKRATLIFRDIRRLERLMTSVDRPLYLLFSGKAHPNDVPGQNLIRTIAEISHMEAFRDKIFLIENYDLEVSRYLVQGVDVWLNTPIRPMEASGTSGQKAGINGVLNCSIRDGWWDEGYDGKNGWAIADEGILKESNVALAQSTEQQADDRDSRSLYRIFEDEIVPLYYRRDSQSVPQGWVSRMKESIRTITPAFSSQRMMEDYDRLLYQPILARSEGILADHFRLAQDLAGYKDFMRRSWPAVAIVSVRLMQEVAGTGVSSGVKGQDVAREETSPEVTTLVIAEIDLGSVWHKDVRVEAVASNLEESGIWKVSLEHQAELRPGVHQYRGVFPGTEEAWRLSGANVRVFPVSANFSAEFELELTTWG